MFVPKWKLRRIFMQFHFFNQLDCSIVRIHHAFIMYLHMQILCGNLVVQISTKHREKNSACRANENIVYVAEKPTATLVLGRKTMPRERQKRTSLSTRTMQLAKCQEHYSLHIVDVADIRPTNMRD